MPQIEVRPAQEKDRDTVLAFCTHTWHWGDYIEYVWDDWLNNPEGKLFVATSDEKPIGVIHMRMLTPTDAWLEGIRVDPEYRQQGIAKALNQEALLEAMRRGAKYARLTVASTNTPSLQMVERSFMRRIGAYATYHAQPDSRTGKREISEQIQLASIEQLDEIIDYLNTSNIFPLVGGLYYASYTGYPITVEFLEAKIKAGQIYLLQRWHRIDGLAITEPREERRGKQLSLGYIDGTAIEAISLLAYGLRSKLSALDLEEVYAYVPDLVLMRDAFTGVEYDWDGAVFYTYERGLE